MKNSTDNKDAQVENNTKRAWGKPSMISLLTERTHGGVGTSDEFSDGPPTTS